MTNRRVVVALGGNAFVEDGQKLTMAGQFRFARGAMASLAPLFEPNVALAIVHGNGPQVGSMLVRVEESLGKAYALPLEVCVAESEGELGYVLSQSLRNVLSDLRVERPIESILTQVMVDDSDPAFLRPTKPIGPFYDASQAEELRARGFDIVEDSGRGYRRVVPSPAPRAILEADIVRILLDAGAIVIAAGGGGVPVIRRDGRLEGVDAVIDKDLSAALLAEAIGADTLLILTAVSNAYLHFRTGQQEALGRVTPARARELLAAGHFGEGSMAPKIEAAARFAERTGRRAAITSPAFAEAALAGRAGTVIEPG